METIDVEAIRAKVALNYRQYRFCSAVAEVAVLGSPECVTIFGLSVWFGVHPEDAGPYGRESRAFRGVEKSEQRAVLVEQVLAVLDGVEHDAPPELIEAFRDYVSELRAESARD